MHALRLVALLLAALLLGLLPARVLAQWNPAGAQWGKSEATDVRVMTWNVADALCSTSAKAEGANNWTAVARTLAALRPDVLVLQECGDNSGNGTGLGPDTVTNLQAAAGLLLRGGFDPFKGTPTGAWVQKYAPAFDLPFVFASSETDGYNRNVILSRWPFADLNGDGKASTPDFLMLADAYATAGDGGLRGWAVGEIDLPDESYAGDLVVGDSHLRSGTSASAHAERVEAAQRIAYVIHHLFGGAGTGVPDPQGAILDAPAAAKILGAHTPVITAGDWNEDEEVNGTKGPAEWITFAQDEGGTDGTDRDGTDMERDEAEDWFTGAANTLGPWKYDSIAWQDSIAVLRRAVLFESASLPAAAVPPELAGLAGGWQHASALASDHRAVFADFILPAAPCNDAVDLGGGTPGTGGLVPRFTVCGTLDPGASADFRLQDARPASPVAAVLGTVSANQAFAGGVLVPSPEVLVVGLFTDAAGTLLVPGVPGGGGPFDLHVQWVVLDPGATAGMALSNAERVSWLP